MVSVDVKHHVYLLTSLLSVPTERQQPGSDHACLSDETFRWTVVYLLQLVSGGELCFLLAARHACPLFLFLF